MKKYIIIGVLLFFLFSCSSSSMQSELDQQRLHEAYKTFDHSIIETEIDRQLKVYPKSITLMTNKIRYLYMRKESKDAENLLKQMIRMKPQLAEAYVGLGMLSIITENKDKEVLYLNKAVNLFSKRFESSKSEMEIQSNLINIILIKKLLNYDTTKEIIKLSNLQNGSINELKYIKYFENMSNKEIAIELLQWGQM